MKVALFSIIVNFIGNYILVDQFGYVGLALTSAVTLSFNALVLGLGLMPAGVTLDLKKLFRSLFCLALVAFSSWLLMSIVRRFFLNLDTNFHTKLDSAIVLVLTGILMIGVFTLGASAYLKSSPLQWIRPAKS
jgi:peptidoglycan biosynthesis protein MviN/MurJ (putative lipid II flippase)